MLITNEGLIKIFAENRSADEIDIIELLKQRNANKRKLIEALDQDIKRIKEQKKATKK